MKNIQNKMRQRGGREEGGEPVPWIHSVNTLLSGSDVAREHHALPVCCKTHRHFTQPKRYAALELHPFLTLSVR